MHEAHFVVMDTTRSQYGVSGSLPLEAKFIATLIQLGKLTMCKKGGEVGGGMNGLVPPLSLHWSTATKIIY